MGSLQSFGLQLNDSFILIFLHEIILWTFYSFWHGVEFLSSGILSSASMNQSTGTSTIYEILYVPMAEWICSIIKLCLAFVLLAHISRPVSRVVLYTWIVINVLTDLISPAIVITIAYSTNGPKSLEEVPWMPIVLSLLIRILIYIAMGKFIRHFKASGDGALSEGIQGTWKFYTTEGPMRLFRVFMILCLVWHIHMLLLHETTPIGMNFEDETESYDETFTATSIRISFMVISIIGLCLIKLHTTSFYSGFSLVYGLLVLLNTVYFISYNTKFVFSPYYFFNAGGIMSFIYLGMGIILHGSCILFILRYVFYGIIIKEHDKPKDPKKKIFIIFEETKVSRSTSSQNKE